MVSLSCICCGSGEKSYFLVSPSINSEVLSLTALYVLAPLLGLKIDVICEFAVKGKSNKSLSFSLMAAANMGVVLFG